MSPWTDCPSIPIDMNLPVKERMKALPDHAVAQGLKLLQGVMAEVPAAARAIADLARIRTAGRFHGEVRAIADRVGVGWRDIMLANLFTQHH